MIGPPAPNLFRQSLRQTILEPISRLHSRTSSATSSRRSVACPTCVRPPDLAHRRLQEEEETARPLPVAVAAPVQAKPAKPARCIPLPQPHPSTICAVWFYVCCLFCFVTMQLLLLDSLACVQPKKSSICGRDPCNHLLCSLACSCIVIEGVHHLVANPLVIIMFEFSKNSR